MNRVLITLSSSHCDRVASSCSFDRYPHFTIDPILAFLVFEIDYIIGSDRVLDGDGYG